MNYRLQQDVALVSVCGEHFLVSAGRARGRVPYLTGITPAGAYFWRLLEQSLSPEQIVSRAAADYRTTAETAWAAFRRFAEDLRQKGYLYTEEVL